MSTPRLNALSIRLARLMNDSKVLGSQTDITSATEDGNVWTNADRLYAANYAKAQIDLMIRRNIASAIQNPLSFQSPYRVKNYFLTETPASGITRNEVQVVYRLEDSTAQGRKFRPISADVFDDYRTVGYSNRDVYPEGVFTISTPIVNNIVPSGVAFDYRAYVKTVNAITLTDQPTRKFIKVSDKAFDDVSRGIRSAQLEQEAAQYIGVYTGSGNFVDGVFGAGANFTPARVHETKYFRSESNPTAQFIKVDLPLVRDLQNNIYSKNLFDSLKGQVSYQSREGVVTDGEFVSNGFSFNNVQSVVGLDGNFNALEVDWEVVDNIQHGQRPDFAKYGTAYGQYTTTIDITGGVVTFRDPNILYSSHVKTPLAIKGGGFYPSGGEKFRLCNMSDIRELQNGTMPLQMPYEYPDGRESEYLFGANESGMNFFPKDLTSSGLFMEYLGIPASIIFGFQDGSFKAFPDTTTASGQLEYLGFSTDTMFYAESFSDEIRFSVSPKTYTGQVNITYAGFPQSVEFFTADADRLRITGTGGQGSMTYAGKPPAYVYTARNGEVEMFPPLAVSWLPSGVSFPSTITAKVQTTHPVLAYTTQDIEYPEEFDALLLDFAEAYLRKENGDEELSILKEKQARAKVVEYLSISQGGGGDNGRTQ